MEQKDCKFVTQLEWVFLHPIIVADFLQGKPVIIRQDIVLSCRFSSGLGIIEGKDTREERKFLHTLCKELFGYTTQTVKVFTSTIEVEETVYNCCCCCVEWCDCSDYGDAEYFPKRGVLINECYSEKKYCVYDQDQVGYVCCVPEDPGNRPAKNKKALGTITRPLRISLNQHTRVWPFNYESHEI